MASSFNLLPLLSVKPELDRSLSTISDELEKAFLPEHDTRPLTAALDELHRMIGVLQMLGLRGLTVFCSEIETLLKEISERPSESTNMRQDAIRRALFGLTHYLAALADGASNATLRLFQEYQDLLQARGIEMAFEVDLFFPELNVDLPASLLGEAQQPDPLPTIKNARMQYQQNLLKWLRQDNPKEALRNMMATMRVVLTCAAPDRSRAFWWVAGGLLNCIFHDGVPPELDVKKSISRIDQRMRALLENNPFDETSALSEMLYLLGRSHTVSEAVESIKNTYDLDTYLPADRSLPPSEMTKTLQNMQTQLLALNEIWERCIADDATACTNFAENANQLYLESELLDRNTLQFLSKQIQTSAADASTPELARLIAMDMTMALLLLGSGIEHYHHLDSGFHEQARLLSMRLQEAARRKPEDAEKLANLVNLYCAMEVREVMPPLAIEMRNNLQQIEQSINTFFSNFAIRSELTLTSRLLNQVQGGLHILSLEIAEQLVSVLRQATSNYQQGVSPSVAEMRSVALGISLLAEYVNGLTLGRKVDDAGIISVLRDLTAIRSSPEPVSAATAAPSHAGVSIRADDVDAELLDIFLEEALEVLETLRTNLDSSRLHVESKEPLVVIRRGFHTLKGGSRMVGLVDFGETAWAIERAMNKWLERNDAATPDLLEMIGDATVLFQHWVDMLKSRSINSHIDTSPLLALAEQVENGTKAEVIAIAEAPAVAAPPVFEMPEAAPPTQPQIVPGPTLAPEQKTEEEAVRIGSVSISPALFRIASEEAAERTTELRTLLEGLRADQRHVVSHDFMRAAHTLAGINRTMGFAAIADLAYALELWLEARINKHDVVADPDCTLIEEAIVKLDAMNRSVREHEEPQPQPELVAQLLAVKELATDTAAQPGPALMGMVEPEPGTSVPAALVELVNKELVAAQAAPEIPAAKPKTRTVHDELDEQLLPIFLEEVQELYPQIGSGLRAWRENSDDMQLGRNLQRSLHTLKGSARMAGAMRLGELTHLVEDRISLAMTNHALDTALWNELDSYLDRIAHAIEQLQTPQPHAQPEAVAAPVSAPTVTVATAPATPEVGAERGAQAALLRVRSEVVDHLVNEAGEISVARSRIETELREFRINVVELTESVNRLRHQLREIEIHAEGQMQARTAVSGESAERFDPLEFDRFTRFQELTRFMNESVHDVQTVQQALLKHLDETSAALSAQSQLNRDLQQGLMGIRMVPFSSIRERLYRVVRQTCKELDKRANLELLGTDIELDRSVLEKMTAPFEHLLRNAIAHGLETPELRTRNGKDPIGEIRFSLQQESNEVIFTCSDDGAGLNLPRIREKALQDGLINANEEISDEQVMQLIFKAGLSTAQEVSEISGRGVGLDVVSSEIAALGGRVDVASKPGEGVRFTIHLPLTLAVTKTLMVKAGHEIYALPASMVIRVEQMKPAELEAVYKQQYLDWQGLQFPMHNLSRLLGNEQGEIVSQPHNPVLLLKSGDYRMALHVDELLGNQDAVVKNIGPQLARVPGIAGATVSGSGAVILIINPVAFTQRIAAVRPVEQAVIAEETLRKVPLVMVVDDSLTVRKITTRILERAGYQVITAKDGIDALEQLMEVAPDVMLLDVEMPRMDGFELAKRLRQDSKTRELPIIMITSRTAEKHRNYAMELGVNEYLGKPYDEDVLLSHIARFTQQPASS